MTVRSKPPEPLRLDCEGRPMPPLQKRYPSVQVPRALNVNEERVLAAVASWVRLGRAATASVPLSSLVDDPHGWLPPNIRLGGHSGRRLSWWRLCALRAVAAQRDMLADFKAVILRVEGAEIDDLGLAKGLELARQLIAATQGRERKFVQKHRLDEPRAEEIEEPPRQETG